MEAIRNINQAGSQPGLEARREEGKKR